MTIDERLDRLVERHEALTQSVELLRLQGEEQGKRIDKLTEDVSALTENVQRVVGVVERLAEIARDHDRRITHLEGGES
jgi:predicted nuclease with TOPRIM domain